MGKRSHGGVGGERWVNTVTSGQPFVITRGKMGRVGLSILTSKPPLSPESGDRSRWMDPRLPAGPPLHLYMGVDHHCSTVREEGDGLDLSSVDFVFRVYSRS